MRSQVSEVEVTKLKSQLTVQKKELEAAAAASLEKAEEAFTKQLAEMQTLLADYQTQVCRLFSQLHNGGQAVLAIWGGGIVWALTMRV
jgi:hypothetical protein